MKTALWLLQLGTPDDPSVGAVRKYLSEFLMDPRMIQLPYPLRLLLVRGIIGIFRSPKSAHAYQQVWMPDGSPLAVYSRRLKEKLSAKFGSDVIVELGMRYGSQNIEESWRKIKQASPEKIIVLPLFPQYASASTGSALQKVFEVVKNEVNTPNLQIVPAFYDQDFFINAFVSRAKEFDLSDYEYFLFSYHGLPEDYVSESGSNCFTPNCCDKISSSNNFCYRAHCYQTTRRIQKLLNLPDNKVGTSFQSRLGRKKWIEPYTDKVITELPTKGVKKLCVFSPSFVADCLETLEEIQIRAAEDFKKAGGEKFFMIPSLNDSNSWCEGIFEYLNKEYPTAF